MCICIYNFFSPSSTHNMPAAWHSSRSVSPAAPPVSTDSISGVKNESGRQRKIRGVQERRRESGETGEGEQIKKEAK